ncbi:unnamed protein product [Echinostoma caproni]|uniref:CCHC-type domain-containing protein n=1 Tax=Echinostoma caproni TaxID=27848 RepID=A0A183BGF5_9TREM|nr:unnamed protein product [Echinostoma caproni]
MQKLENFARDYNSKAVMAEQNEDAIRDAFISSAAYDQAKALDLAQQRSQTFVEATPSIYTSAVSALNQTPEKLAASRTSCYFCGYDRHPRHKCHTKDTT